MSLAQPSPAQERWLVLAARYPALRALAEVQHRTGGWKTSSWLSRCLFFVLGLAGASMILGSLMFVPGRLLLAGLAMLMLTEWMIAQRRVVRSGIEEALHVVGLGCIAAQLVLWMHRPDAGLVAATLALAPLLSGLRLLNPLFTALAAVIGSFAVALSGGSVFLEARLHKQAAALACLALGIAALVAGGRRHARPSHDAMLDGLVIAMPVAAWAWATWAAPGAPRLAAAAPQGLAVWLPALIPAGFILACVVLGVRRCRHAPLVAALACTACLAHALRALTGLPLYWRLILWGLVALAAAVLLEHWLRRPRGGITSQDVGEDSRHLDMLQTAGAALATPRAGGSEGQAAFQGKGGEFGGGGAGGRF